MCHGSSKKRKMSCWQWIVLKSLAMRRKMEECVRNIAVMKLDKSVKGEQRCMKSGMADSSENRIKEHCSHVTSEYLAVLAQKILEEIKESRGKDKAVVSSGVIDGDKEEKIREIEKMPFQLLGHEKKHARNEGQVALEGEQENKKARMVESSWNKGEDEEPL